MKRIKTITTQDHIIHVVEADSFNDEHTCMNDEKTDRLMLKELLTVFLLEGSIKGFRKNASDEWELSATATSPSWIFAKPDMTMGVVAATPITKEIVFIPKNITDLASAPDATLNIDLDEIMNIDRETFVEIGSITVEQKVDSDSFDEIEESLDEIVPDDVIIE